MCSAPVIRRLLMRLNAGHPSSRLSPSFLAINFTVFVVCLLAVCPLYVPAEMLGSSFRYVQDGFTGLQGLLAEAKGTGNIALLASAIIHVESLGKQPAFSCFGTEIARLISAFPAHPPCSDEGLRRKSRSALIGGAIYSAEVVIFFLFGLIPSLLLNTYMRKRIDRLERGLSMCRLRLTWPLRSNILD